MRETCGLRRVGRPSMVNGVKSRWAGELSHSWRAAAGAKPEQQTPPVRRRRRRSQALAQEAFGIFVATGDNLLSRALIQMMKAQGLSRRSSSKQTLPYEQPSNARSCSLETSHAPQMRSCTLRLDRNSIARVRASTALHSWNGRKSKGSFSLCMRSARAPQPMDQQKRNLLLSCCAREVDLTKKCTIAS